MLSYPSAAFRASAPRGTVLKLWDGKDIPSGLNVGAVNGRLSLSKASLGNQTAIFPDADIEVQGTHEVVQSSWTARNHGLYTAIASATVTDPSTPAAGHEFTTLVRNGTLTTSRDSYSVSGTLVRSVWHSGSWTDYPYGPLNAANTWTAAQAFRANGSHFFGIVATTGLTNVTADGGNSGTNGGASFFVRGNGATTAAWGNFSSILGGAYDARTTIYSAASNIVFQHGGTTAATLDTSSNFGLAVAPTAGNGLLQLASGTTKANGIAFGTDTFFYRLAAGNLAFQASAGLWSYYSVKNGNGTLQVDLRGEDSLGAVGTQTNHPFNIITNNANRIRIGAAGELHMFGGTPVTRSTYGAPTGTATRTTFDTTTVTLPQLAERVKAMIDDFRARGDFA